MGLIFDLYRLKLKVFFGSLKASKVSIILLFLYSLSTVLGLFGTLTSSINFLRETADLMLYSNALSAVLSGFLALGLMSTFRGITAFEYEQSFIFTSPITSRQFLTASLLSDGTASLLFLYPLPIFLAITVFSLGLSVSAILTIFISSLLFFLFVLLLRISLSIWGAIFQNPWMKIFTTILIVILLFPATSIFTPITINYDSLPYPTTFIAQIMLRSLSDKNSPTISLFGFSLYLIASLAFFYLSSKRNLFHFASPTPLISAFDTSMRMQTKKSSMNIKLFSKIGLKITLTSESKSLLTFLMKKEFIRMLRDGSLFTIFLLYLIVSIMMVTGSARGMPVPIWLVLLALYSFIVPPILVGNWRVVELKSLWIPLTSGMNLSYLAKSTLYDFTIVASTVPVAIIFILTFITHIDPLIPLVLVISVAMIGCSVNLDMVMRFLSRRSRATPSIMISWVSFLLTGLLIAPVYAFIVFSFLSNFGLELNVALSVLSLAYSTLIFTFFSKRMSRKASFIEL